MVFVVVFVFVGCLFVCSFDAVLFFMICVVYGMGIETWSSE